MSEMSMGSIMSVVMMFAGDVFTVLALLGSVMFLLGVLFKSRELAARGGAGALFALAFTIWAFIYKLGEPGSAELKNGLMLQMSNGMVAVLLAFAILLLLIGFGLIMWMRTVRVRW